MTASLYKSEKHNQGLQMMSTRTLALQLKCLCTALPSPGLQKNACRMQRSISCEQMCTSFDGGGHLLPATWALAGTNLLGIYLAADQVYSTASVVISHSVILPQGSVP